MISLYCVLLLMRSLKALSFLGELADEHQDFGELLMTDFRGSSPRAFIWRLTTAVALVGIVAIAVNGCNAPPAYQPFGGYPGGRKYYAGGVSGSGDDSGSVAEGKAMFRQNSGKLNHPQRTSDLAKGELDVDLTQAAIVVTISGITTSDTNNDVRNGVANMGGKSTFDRVLYGKLPADPRYKDHPYLIFAKAVTNKKDVRFTAAENQFFPAFAVGEYSAAAYDKLTNAGSVSYPVNFSASSGGTFTATFTVSRTTTSAPNGCDKFDKLTPKVSDQSRYYGIKIDVSGVPNNFVNEFPVSNMIFLAEFQGGGRISEVASCSPFYDTKSNKSGVVAMSFEK